jgi:hypothetical protein
VALLVPQIISFIRIEDWIYMRWLSVFALSLAICSKSFAVELDADLKACLKKNEPDIASLQTIELRSWDRIGSQKVTVADIYVKRTGAAAARMLAYFREPEDIRGTRLLGIVEENRNDMFVYVPILFKVRRITAKRLSTSVHGTDFSYEDLEWVYGLTSHADVQRKPDQLMEGEQTYVIEAGSSAEAASGYELVVSYLDKETCVPRRVEFFERGRKLRKVLTVDPEKIRSIGDLMIPHQYVMEDLRDKTKTQLTVRNIRLGIQVPDQVLEPDGMKEFSGIQ